MSIAKIMSKVTTTFAKKSSGLKFISSEAVKSAPKVNVGFRESLKVPILKPRQQRFEHAVDLMGKRNPTDFVAKDEVAKEIQRLINEKAKVVNIGLFKCSGPQAKYLAQIESDINAGKKLLKIMG